MPTYDEALLLVTNNPWTSTSRNWWYQSVVAELLRAYPGFLELVYLTEIVAVIPIGELSSHAQAIRRLISAIDINPEPMVVATTWYGASADQIRQHITEAKVLRNLDDDSRYAFGNFFSYLVSQAAALEEAAHEGKCLLYVQPQP